MKLRRLLGVALLCAPLLGSQGEARAQSAADIAAARDLFIAAAAAAKEGRWEEARAGYQRALSLKRSPGTLYGLALAESKTGKVVEAIEHYRAFLVEAKPDDPYRESAKGQITELEPRVARIEITLSPAAPGAEVSVDGVPVPAVALGLPRRVDGGKHVVSVKADGYEPATKEVEVAEGKSVKAELVLRVARVEVAPPPPVGKAPSRSFVAGASVLGAGAAVFAVGLGVGLSGVADAGAAPTRDGPQAADARLRMNVGDVVGAIGAAAGLAGVVLLIYEGVRPLPQKAAVGGTQPRWMVGRAGVGFAF